MGRAGLTKGMLSQAGCSPEQVGSALLAGRLCAFAQGFALLAAGGRVFGWPLDLTEAARVWRGGCIIRTRLLPILAEALGDRRGAANLLAAPPLAALIAECDAPWRRVIGGAVADGLPVPALLSALSYRDGLATRMLGTNLIQAQRDCFGAHGFQRVDRPGRFHADWGGER